ncbi:prepilin peptidase [Antarcticirhabdus aurantiaca]|uniref:Prepilin peptidase n=1 Tax=Antarcticirhabdus aurantiaca TaxID=2606717 RepID=A0ACD4NLU5_9HYPH|nr:prepilin peptidase [Antarcticirhabdus aurantiaca]WAJ27828.1 prepilin peptidase [Jeongeuplla avenae]
MEYGASLGPDGPATPPLLLALFLCLLLWAALSDAQRGIIPNACNAAIAALGLLAAVLPGGVPLLASRLLDAGLVGGLLLALRALHRRRRGTVGLGLGDVKLLAAGTLWLGLSGLFLALLLACVAALLQVAVLRVAGRPVGRATRLRFGPHLALGLAVVLVLDAAYFA